MTRREFNWNAVAGAILVPEVVSPSVRESDPFTAGLFAAADRWGEAIFRAGFLETMDIGTSADLPSPLHGMRHYLRFGRTNDFFGGCWEVAREVGRLIGTTDHDGRVRAILADFFGNRDIESNSPGGVLVCRGHVTTRHAFNRQGQTVGTLAIGLDGGVRPILGRCPRLEFGYGWERFAVEFPTTGEMFRKPDGRDKQVLMLRRRRRVYQAAGCPMEPSDTITQYGVSDFGDDYKAIRAGGYYPNSEDLRRKYNHVGYTDVTVVTLARVVRSSPDRPVRFLHQINIAVNRRNPTELMDINTLVRPVPRLFDQHPAHLDVLRAEVAKHASR